MELLLQMGTKEFYCVAVLQKLMKDPQCFEQFDCDEPSEDKN